jgi:GNAT superfamily N-acetyltransferase
MLDPRLTNISIRLATAADHILLAEVGAETFRDTFAVDNTPEDMAAYLAGTFGPDRQAAELADPASRFLLAELDGETAGYARLRFGAAPAVVRGARPIEIARLYARRRWIGCGVGATLIQACLAEAERTGCDCVWLDVWERNPRAIAFYAKWGFAVVGEQTFPLGSDLQRDLLMMRSIGGSP